jgi:hypothetical protein
MHWLTLGCELCTQSKYEMTLKIKTTPIKQYNNKAQYDGYGGITYWASIA